MAIILVVDDDQAASNLIAFVLRSAGHQVNEATDGITAFDCYLANPPQAIITDIQMPNLDGIGLITAIRLRDAHIPIVAVSAGERGLEGARLAGADLCLIKPFDCGDVLAWLDSRVSG